MTPPRPLQPPQARPIGWISVATLAAFHAARTDAHRIASSADAWVERFGNDALVSYKDERLRDGLLAGISAWEATSGLRFSRVFGKFLPRDQGERVAPLLWRGDATMPLTGTVEENGLRFGVDFAAGYSSGLFIDQRANRAFLRGLRVKRLLNTFAYTCAFSVAAAAGGAETVSIDLSKKSLDRGRANFVLNQLDPASHRFVADDVLEVLPRLARRGESFDAVILDPPTFSRGNKGRRFRVENDLEPLLASALEVAAPQARVLVSTNCARIEGRTLELIAHRALKLTRRAADFHREPELPDLPRELAARTLWLRLKQ